VIKYCDYGCGQKAKYQFKNGRWCCSRKCNSCLAVRKRISKSNKNPSEETREKLRKSQLYIRKGKTYEEIFGNEKAKKLREVRRKSRLGGLNPMYGKPQTEETKRKNRETHLGSMQEQIKIENIGIDYIKE
jgi:hypothetical protein